MVGKILFCFCMLFASNMIAQRTKGWKKAQCDSIAHISRTEFNAIDLQLRKSLNEGSPFVISSDTLAFYLAYVECCYTSNVFNKKLAIDKSERLISYCNRVLPLVFWEVRVYYEAVRENALMFKKEINKD